MSDEAKGRWLGETSFRIQKITVRLAAVDLSADSEDVDLSADSEDVRAHKRAM